MVNFHPSVERLAEEVVSPHLKWVCREWGMRESQEVGGKKSTSEFSTTYVSKQIEASKDSLNSKEQSQFHAENGKYSVAVQQFRLKMAG